MNLNADSDVFVNTFLTKSIPNSLEELDLNMNGELSSCSTYKSSLEVCLEKVSKKVSFYNFEIDKKELE